MHSTASDGELAPAALMAAVARAGVRVAALTDHDSVAALAEARLVGAELGVQLINGVEISCRWDAHDIHIVGLGVDPESSALQAHLARHLSKFEEPDRIEVRPSLPKTPVGKLSKKDLLAQEAALIKAAAQ